MNASFLDGVQEGWKKVIIIKTSLSTEPGVWPHLTAL